MWLTEHETLYFARELTGSVPIESPSSLLRSMEDDALALRIVKDRSVCQVVQLEQLRNPCVYHRSDSGT